MQRRQYITLTYGWDEGRQDPVWAGIEDLAVNAETVNRRLNELGNEGWELINNDKMSGYSHVAGNFYLKRQLENSHQSLS